MKKQLLVLSLLSLIGTSGSLLCVKEEEKKKDVKNIISLPSQDCQKLADLMKEEALIQKYGKTTEEEFKDLKESIDQDIKDINGNKWINGCVKDGNTLLNCIKTKEKIKDQEDKETIKTNRTLTKNNAPEVLSNVTWSLGKYALTGFTFAAMYFKSDDVLKGFGKSNPLKELIGKNFSKISTGLFYGVTGLLGLDSLRGLFSWMKLSSLNKKIEDEKLINFSKAKFSEISNNKKIANVEKDLQKRVKVLETELVVNKANDALGDDEDKYVIAQDGKITKGDSECVIGENGLQKVSKTLFV
jgi:hypothetical protein